jgi:outer membrane protein assembly factor BamB
METAAPAVSYDSTPANQPRPIRLWFPAALLAVYWIAVAAIRASELTTFVRFASGFGSFVLTALVFLGWWVFSRRLSRREKWTAVAALITGAAAGAVLSRGVLEPVPFVWVSFPFVFTAWTLWLIVARNWPPARRAMGLVLATFLTFVPFTLIRVDGLSGEQQARYAWRWNPSAEDLYLAERAGAPASVASTAPAGAPSAALTVRPGDWPGFRGPGRDGVVAGVRVATDWSAAPPRLAWRSRIGPAWSSVAVVDGMLFTQEQRGDAEAVVCRDAATGAERWSVQDPGRFWESVSGAGPRATPTVDSGRLYALGALGRLNCLDAATGARLWSRDIKADAAGGSPMWGFSSSPLVTNGVVIVFGGGDGSNGLRAYRCDTGEPVWAATAGGQSYTSPQLVELGGEKQVLFLGDAGLGAHDPATGALRWSHPVPMPNAPRAIQPRAVGPGQVLVCSEMDIGARLLDVASSTVDGAARWSVSPRWTSRHFKPSFNDFVLVGDSAYGFDGAVFCCFDLTAGKRRWRDGRYGHGQVLLLADQSLLLVITEEGEAVLVAADPDAHRELGRAALIKGKTWNHPAIAQGRLYVRNAEEMACYELPRPTE